jgi:hypothetical protein
VSEPWDTIEMRNQSKLEAELIVAKAKTAELQAQLKAKQALDCRLYNSGYHAGHHDTVEGMYTDIYPVDMDSYHDDLVAEIVADEEAQEAGE